MAMVFVTIIYGCRWLSTTLRPLVTMTPAPLRRNINVFDWDEDYAVTVTDFLMMLSVYGDVDVDFDGVWDSGDLCVWIQTLAITMLSLQRNALTSMFWESVGEGVRPMKTTMASAMM